MRTRGEEKPTADFVRGSLERERRDYFPKQYSISWRLPSICWATRM